MTLLEIESAVRILPAAQKRRLVQLLLTQLNETLVPSEKQALPGHSVLDIPAVSIGEILKPFSSDDDILGEMLEGRL